MKQGDRFIEELARQEADARIRAELLKELMAHADKVELCPTCGADRKAYRETLGEECCQ